MGQWHQWLSEVKIPVTLGPHPRLDISEKALKIRDQVPDPSRVRTA